MTFPRPTRQTWVLLGFIALLSCFLPGIVKGCGKDHVLMEVKR